VLFALREPIAFVGLLLAFVLALVIRTVAIRLVQRRRVPAGWGSTRRSGGKAVDFKRDVDVFGAVAAVVGGTGWGKRVDDAGLRPAPVKALLAGPIAVLVASQLAFLAFVLTTGYRYSLRGLTSSSILHGDYSAPALDLFLLSLAVGLLCFGILAFFPIPPLDGWGLLRHAVKRPGTGFQKAAYWLDEQNVGIAILLAGVLLPLFAGLPLFLFLLDLITGPVFYAWSA
jgi:hypothetical protein